MFRALESCETLCKKHKIDSVSRESNPHELNVGILQLESKMVYGVTSITICHTQYRLWLPVFMYHTLVSYQMEELNVTSNEHNHIRYSSMRFKFMVFTPFGLQFIKNNNKIHAQSRQELEMILCRIVSICGKNEPLNTMFSHRKMCWWNKRTISSKKNKIELTLYLILLLLSYFSTQW